MNTLEAALELVDRGKSVIPIEPSGKRPVVEWEEYQRRLATRREIMWWWEYTRNKIAIVTGRTSGVVVLDYDSPGGKEYGLEKCAATGVVCQTPSGGEHHYYKYPAGEVVGNRVKIAGLGFDLRAEGGYVLCPPSENYRWVRTGEMAEYDPSWLPQKTYRVQEPVENGTREQARAYIAKIRSVAGQGGDNAAFRAATALVQKFGLGQEEALEEMRIWNTYCAEPRWPESRLRYKLDQARKAATPAHGQNEC